MEKRNIMIALILTGLMIVPVFFVGCGQGDSPNQQCDTDKDCTTTYSYCCKSLNPPECVKTEAQCPQY